MRIALIIAASLFALILLTAFLGALMPRAQLASGSAMFRATPEQVWALVTDVGTYTNSRPDVTSAEVLPLHDGRAS